MSQQQARISIENTGLTMGTATEQLSDLPRGLVVASNPPAGTKIELPGNVDIVLSKGPATIQVPDLYGRSIGEARSMIEQLGLRIAGISRDTISLQPENTVIRQLPEGQGNVFRGGPVSLTVSHFPPPPRSESIGKSQRHRRRDDVRIAPRFERRPRQACRRDVDARGRWRGLDPHRRHGRPLRAELTFGAK